MSLFNFFAGTARGPELMERMMARFGVRSVLAEKPHAGEVLRRATIRCVACKDKDACVAWLDDETSDGTEVPTFCRNHDLIMRLEREIPQTSAA